jgi:hypothetical protein
MMQRFSHFLIVSISALMMLGCQGFNPVTDTAGYFFQSNWSQKNGIFKPGFEYLELDWQGRKTALALGYRNIQGSQVVEHWYSGQGEVLKLHNGRIVQVNGMTQEVRYTSTDLPVWAELLAHRLPVVWSQTKDTMPGYRYGLQEFVISQQVTAIRAEASLLREPAQWVLEEVKSKQISGQMWIYQQKFAIQNDRVIYSEQCVAYDMCFKLKPLGVVVPQ